MIISDVTINELKNYCQVYHNEDDALFGNILVACKYFISAYTGLPITDPDVDDLDTFEDLTVALLIIASEMYDNRRVQVEFDKIGFVIKQLLDAHSINLL